MKLDKYIFKKVSIKTKTFSEMHFTIEGILQKQGVFYFINNKNCYCEFCEELPYKVIKFDDKIQILI